MQMPASVGMAVRSSPPAAEVEEVGTEGGAVAWREATAHNYFRINPDQVFDSVSSDRIVARPEDDTGAVFTLGQLGVVTQPA